MRKDGVGRQIMFFPMFLIIGVIALGIIWGVIAFYGEEYDVREAEARILAERVVDCFEEYDFFVEGFDERIYESCRLRADVLTDHLIYVHDLEGERSFLVGVADFQNQCFFNAAERNADFPRCVTVTLEKDDVVYELIVGARQQARRIF